ncbi:MAG: DUF3568 family protein [Verrucomicrobiia bacterium]
MKPNQRKVLCEKRTIAKAFNATIFTTCVFAAMALFQGCALLLVGGAVGGATYGAVKYAGNTLQVTHDVALDRAWNSANAALKELQIPVTSSKNDQMSGHLEGRNAQEQPVSIDLLRKTEKVTQIRIAVGRFDTSANREGSQLIYDRMKARF